MWYWVFDQVVRYFTGLAKTYFYLFILSITKIFGRLFYDQNSVNNTVWNVLLCPPSLCRIFHHSCKRVYCNMWFILRIEMQKMHSKMRKLILFNTAYLASEGRVFAIYNFLRNMWTMYKMEKNKTVMKPAYSQAYGKTLIEFFSNNLTVIFEKVKLKNLLWKVHRFS